MKFRDIIVDYSSPDCTVDFLIKTAEFISEIKKLGLEFEPTPGNELADQLSRMTQSASPQVMERLRQIASQTK